MLDEIQSQDAWSEDRWRDMSFLEAQCRWIGLPKLEEALREAANRHGGAVAAIHGALRAEAHWLLYDASALSVRIHDRLLSSGWDEARIGRELRFPSGLPTPRLRHPVQSSEAELTLEGHEAAVRACAVTPDGRRLVSASQDGTLRVWDLRSGDTLAVLRGHDDEVRDCAVMPDGRRVVSASEDGTLRIWDLERGRTVATLAGHRCQVMACAVSPDGRRIVSASLDGTLRIWDVATGQTVATLVADVRRCAITPDGRRIVSASSGGLLKVWSMATGEALATFQAWTGYNGWRCPCAVSPDGKQIVTATADGLRTWSLETLEPAATFYGSSAIADACVVTRDGRHVVLACSDWTFRVWALATGREIAVLPVERFGHDGTILGCVATPDGSHIVSTSGDRSVRIWSLEAALARSAATAPRAPSSRSHGPPRGAAGVNRASGRASQVEQCLVTPDGRRAVSLLSSGKLQVRSLETGTLLSEIAVEPTQDLRAMATGDRCAVLQRRQALYAFDLETGARIGSLLGDDVPLVPGAVVPGDRWIVLYTMQGPGIQVWDLEACRTFSLAEAQRLGCVTTPAQRCALLEGSIVTWDEGGKLLSSVALPDRSTIRWLVAPDGKRLLTSTKEGRRWVRVWDVATGRESATLVHREPPFAQVLSLPFFTVTPDGRRAVTACHKGKSICLWDLETGAQLGMIYLEWASVRLAATNEVVCTHGPLGDLWVFELPPAPPASAYSNARS